MKVFISKGGGGVIYLVVGLFTHKSTCMREPVGPVYGVSDPVGGGMMMCMHP